MPLKVLVLGSGGREHALAWRLARSPSVAEVHAAPGNPGIARVAHCYDINPKDAKAVCALARSLGAELTVVGPEAPLVAGVADGLRAEGLRVVGPGAEAAQLEGSKIFAKKFMAEYGIPTAGYATANSLAEARAALDRFDYPVVLKADGLAAGKGVIIAADRAEALAAVESLISGAHVGEAGARLVMEEFLTGEEVSFIALCDGGLGSFSPRAGGVSADGPGFGFVFSGGRGASSADGAGVWVRFLRGRGGDGRGSFELV
jgi:phosphoribosylamine---glycine ligase